jgi:endonuclease/exonuclease/phosphatase family metal-dependent hydrolase
LERFEAWFPDARQVDLVGAFSDWRPVRAHREGDRWRADLALRPGLWPYRWQVDGQWRDDPTARFDLDNGHGGRDAVRVVLALPPRQGYRIATLNLHCWQEDRPLRKLEEAAIALAALEVDLVALQEVGAPLQGAWPPNAGDHLAGCLRRFTPDPWAHAWEEAHLGFGSWREGLSLLGRRGLASPRRVSLSGGPLARVAVVAEADGRRWASVHLSGGQAGATEARRLLERLDPGPAFVLGDFNGGLCSPVAQVFRRAGFLDLGPPGGTFLATGERLHTVYARGQAPAHRAWRILDGGSSGQPAVSDHAGVLVELTEATDAAWGAGRGPGC